MCGLSLVHIHNLIGPEKGIGHSLMWLNNRKVLNIHNFSHWNTTNSHRVWCQVAWKKFRSLKELFSIQTIKNQCLNEMSCYCNITLWIAISQYFSVKKYIVMHWPENICKTKIQILAFRETFLQSLRLKMQVCFSWVSPNLPLLYLGSWFLLMLADLTFYLLLILYWNLSSLHHL